MTGNWMDKIKHKLTSYIAREHIGWSEWNSIWLAIKAKEYLDIAPWWEYTCGANANGQLFQKQYFGLWDSNQKVSLSKIGLEWFKQPQNSLHLFKKQQELCSTSTVAAESKSFWVNLKQQSFEQAKAKVESNFQGARLKLVDTPETHDKQMESEQKVYNWVNTTLMVLKNAISQSANNPSQFLTARILIGKLPFQDQIQIQVHCFNVEINFMSLNGKNWQILAYDHRDGSVKDLKPSLSSNIELQAKNIWSLLDNLIQEIIKN